MKLLRALCISKGTLAIRNICWFLSSLRLLGNSFPNSPMKYNMNLLKWERSVMPLGRPGWNTHQVAKVLEFQLQHPKKSFQRNPRADLLQNGLVGSPSSPRDSQESSPTPQFKSINSSALSLLHSPTLTSVHDHRKNHSLD